MKPWTNILFAGILALGWAPTIAATGGPSWQTPARWHHFPRKPVQGILSIGNGGIEFRSTAFTHRWTYLEIHTFDLSSRELTLTTYEDRRWHEPGERRYRFTFKEPVPPETAATLSDRVGKPARDEVPAGAASAFEEIPAHRRSRFGGSNGNLRLKDDGIDYIAPGSRDSRSWRWADIQTIANPNPYELRVTGYREIVEFELKRPLARADFERLWDRLYGAGLNLSARGESR